MDGKKRVRGEEKEAVRPVPTAGGGGSEAGASWSPTRSVRKGTSSPNPAAPPADDEPADIGIGAVDEDDNDDDDDKVERFYALLANIRAMRGLLPMCVASATSCGGVDNAGGGGARKRLRAAEPPWRPAFRMEDFEVVVEPAAPAPPPSKREQQTKPTAAAADGDDHGKSVVVAPSLPHAAARCDSGSYKD